MNAWAWGWAVCAVAVLCGAPVQAAGTATEGLGFNHHDWELACDNTRACKAAGYQADGDEAAVSLLLTRKAGPRQPVTGQLMLGEYGDPNPALAHLPSPLKPVLRVNGQAHGVVPVDKTSRTGELSARQVAVVLGVLPKTAAIELALGEQVWRLSDRGAAAVLLKMDEFQGRLGTPGALVKPGAKSEDTVPAERPMPVVRTVPLAKPQAGDDRFVARQGKALQVALRQTVKPDDCPHLVGPEAEPGEWTAVRLTPTRMLVSGTCWRAAYNAGSGFWVVNTQPPYDPVLVTTNGTDRVENTILAQHKGRGLGDCLTYDEWTWTASGYVHTRSATSGLCKLVSPGGAWDLPTRITDVR
ncbi:MAG: hypothetical protein RJA09_2902 [Pseudomonadota bacterium]